MNYNHFKWKCTNWTSIFPIISAKLPSGKHSRKLYGNYGPTMFLKMNSCVKIRRIKKIFLYVFLYSTPLISQWHKEAQRSVSHHLVATPSPKVNIYSFYNKERKIAVAAMENNKPQTSLLWPWSTLRREQLFWNFLCPKGALMERQCLYSIWSPCILFCFLCWMYYSVIPKTWQGRGWHAGDGWRFSCMPERV